MTDKEQQKIIDTLLERGILIIKKRRKFLDREPYNYLAPSEDFKQKFGTTPFRWIKQQRLDYAKQLLIKSDLNVNQICYECGFINCSHFVRVFKEAFELPPNQFRMAVLESPSK